MPDVHRWLAGLCAAWLLACGVGWTAERAAEPMAGVFVTYRDGDGPKAVVVVRREAGIAVAWKPGEAAHPRLRGESGGVRWEGGLKVLRRGTYRFSVRLRGRFRLEVAGKQVLDAEVKDERPTLRESGDVELPTGTHRLVAEFTRRSGRALVELMWASPHFRREPIPYDCLECDPLRAPAQWTEDARAERGRVLAEEHGCVRCHLSTIDNPIAGGMAARSGPDLSQVGRRVRPGWLMRWLGSPDELRPGAVMPRMFGADEAGRVERYAVTRYLISLGGPLRENEQSLPREQMQDSAMRGERLYQRIGCSVCHGAPGSVDTRAKREMRTSGFFTPPRVVPLFGLGSKTTPERLAEYLKDPLAIDPGGRMPNMLLTRREAEDLARFLCRSKAEGVSDELPATPKTEQMLAAFRRVDNRADELAEFKRLPADRQWVDLGKRIVIDRGCNNCHTIAPEGQPFASVQASASLEDLQNPDRWESGCLAETATKRGHAPGFAFRAEERRQLRAFLRAGLNGAGSPAPAHAARADLQRFNCLACHRRAGDGGLSAAVLARLLRIQKTEDAEAVSPPPLTGVGHKVRTPWLRQVLTDAGRARPWMALRMPQFGAANIGRLLEGLAALEGTESDDAIHKVPTTDAVIEAGRSLVGSKGLGCIACHDLAGIASTGTRGPDLARMTQRVRYDWYRRWLEQPQRLQPGTRMPTVFPEGKSLLEKVLDGRADAQADALWSYLSLGPSLPLPAGVERPKQR
jgi:cbb3-type cytochrome oxidase cytochrome c subunit